MSDLVITRFAPSPTGQMHIGGVRTALFNWLYAKHHKGKMLLRIEDTDLQRSSSKNTEEILESLTWLGIMWDDEPVSQYSRINRHREIAYELVRRGAAYFCYATKDELEEIRHNDSSPGLFVGYDRRWRDQQPTEKEKNINPVIRIKAPLTGVTVLEDQVQGRIECANKDLDDFVILRSDGTSTYMHASVVDDHDMGITHVIRGDDHLTNAFRQTLIYRAMGWNIPIMAHIPLIHGEDGTKLSKRHGATAVESYRKKGYIPEGLLNYLVRLGWSHGNDEIMSLEQMIEWFDVKEIKKSPARFDIAKLEAVNGIHMRQMSDEKLFALFMTNLPFLENGEEVSSRLTPENKEKILLSLPFLKERSKTLQELLHNLLWLFTDRPLEFDDAAKKNLQNAPLKLFEELYPTLFCLKEKWNKPIIEEQIRLCAKEQNWSLKEIAQPLRGVLTGKSTSPGLFDVLLILGFEESMKRIADYMKETRNKGSESTI